MKYLSTQPLKGFRDFTPEDWSIQKYMFSVCEKVAIKYNFKEYSGPILEDISIYNKSGGDIGSLGKDLYAFTDRGDRTIALRPEMTPTVGRMVAAYSKNYPKPLKWFSIAQFFRSENPQKGRGREFYQLNADIFGEDSILADYEVLSLTVDILKAFGATKDMFKVRINNRAFMNYFFKESLKINDNESIVQIIRLIDAKDKNSAEWFKTGCEKFLDEDQFGKLLELLSGGTKFLSNLPSKELNSDVLRFVELLDTLKNTGLNEYCEFDPKIARGFDYYTGMVFEVFDTNEKNTRSLYGGGRYDDLTSLFGSEKIPAVGFAIGDMTLRLFLEGWDLLPKGNNDQALIYLPILIEDKTYFNVYKKIADELRSSGNIVQMGLKFENIAKAMTYSYKCGASKMIILGEQELKNSEYKIKDLVSKEEVIVKLV